MAPSFLEPEGICDRFKRKGAVDHRVTVDRLDAADQVHLMTATADDQALEALLPGHKHGCWHGSRPPGQHANQRDMPPTRAAWIDCASVPGPPTSTT
jgi:hypothetical protein